jgi:hypothetical protein
MSNVPNYTEQGGAKTVIGGTLEIPGALDLTGATITGAVTAAVVNNLTTTATGSALDAAQGKALKTLVDARATTASIVNDLTTGGVAVPLSAEQGKVLGARKSALVAEAAGANPTAAEFKALLDALKAAGLMATT